MLGVAVTVGVKLLEILFVTGMLGSAVVILLTGIEDIKTVFSTDSSEQ